ncbi:YtxH domain-containing protein [Vibrio intestinalis]|uniref:YtxH domain-containing protein n=1 Tax=Vibrio intestinalis TaxID=2933291 RepID=UPI0021A4DCDE|nr:YtxH domain-containing protein [Vibrio intestinalis]
MSDKHQQGDTANPYAQMGEAPQGADQQVPPHGGFYGYPPHMMPPPHFADPRFAQAQMEQAQVPPHMAHMPPPMWHHPMWMHHPAYCHPSMMPPPYWHQHPHMHPPTQAQPEEEQPDPLFEQAQAMLDGALGEEAGMFKELLGSLGMNDKEFWKGAMVGAAAALLLSNENVRGKLMGLVSGAGDMLKTGGGAVKDTATNTAHSVKENVATGGEIFRDTYSAGKQGFQESVERHQQAKQEPAAEQPVAQAVEAEPQAEEKPE